MQYAEQPRAGLSCRIKGCVICRKLRLYAGTMKPEQTIPLADPYICPWSSLWTCLGFSEPTYSNQMLTAEKNDVWKICGWSRVTFAPRRTTEKKKEMCHVTHSQELASREVWDGNSMFVFRLAACWVTRFMFFACGCVYFTCSHHEKSLSFLVTRTGFPNINPIWSKHGVRLICVIRLELSALAQMFFHKTM